MTVRYVTGDLFEQPVPALAHGVNCAGAMGKGIAVEFKKRWPAMYREYFQRCARGDLHPGGVFSYPTDSGPYSMIYNLATQAHWRTGATLEVVGWCISNLLIQADRHAIQKIAMPRIGCGLGGLEWKAVQAEVERIANNNEIELIVVSLPEKP